MSELAVMPLADYKGICDKVREKTGTTEPIKSGDMVSMLDNIGGGEDTLAMMLTDNLTEFSNDEITHLKPNAFYFCQSLKEVDLPNVETTGTGCFGYTAIEHLYLPKFKKEPNNNSNVFAYMTKVKTITLPSVTQLPGSAFSSNDVLEKIDLGENITSTGYNCFYGRKALTALIIRSPNCKLNNNTGLNNTPIASGTGWVYVYRDYVDTYKSMTNWSTYATQFRAIEDYPEICGGAE